MIRFSISDKLISQAKWLVRIRWIVSIGLILMVSIGYYFSIAHLNYIALYYVAFSLVAFNFISFGHLIYIERKQKSDEETDKGARYNIITQIVSDYLFLSVILHYSGGIENPCIIFFIFHMIIGSIVLPPRYSYILAGLANFLLITITTTEYLGVIKHYSINKYITELIANEPFYLFGSMVIFVITSFLAVYFAVTLSGKLRLTQLLLNQSNQILLEKDKIKNEFIQRLSHDIKGSLSSISSLLGVVEKQILGPISPQNAEFVSKALVRTSKLKLFLNDLLMLTRMRLDNRFETTRVNVKNVIRNVIARVKPDAEEKNITITYDIPDDSLCISGVEVSVEEAIFNIVHNAIKYTPAEGKVFIDAKLDQKEVLISVSDTGYGIPENEIPYIFDEFYRAKNVATNIEGTGIGLSLVKAIIDRHNGKILVNSNLDKGTTFKVWFKQI
jgi:signal transduction histidine kinase